MGSGQEHGGNEAQQGLVSVATFTGMDEAAVARGMLEQEGIETFLANEHLVTLAWTLSQAAGGVRLEVASGDAERARNILASAADRAVVLEEGPEAAEEENEPPATAWAEDEPADPDLFSEADMLVERAWKSTLVGFFALPPLLHVWALWLLRRAYAAGGPRTDRGRALASRALVVSGCATVAFVALYSRILLR